MISNPHSHQEIYVFLDKIPNTSKFSGIKAMILFEFNRIQINLNTFFTLENVHVRWQMIISVDSYIIAMPLPV